MLMDEIKAKLEAELEQVRGEIESRKHQIKRAVGDVLALEAAEADLRSLRTRLSRLESNHQKLVGDVSC
jgi:septal ring factor EnvC (AmiA/AmiB activator)